MDAPAKLRIRGVCLCVTSPNTLMVLFPKTSGLGDCTHAGLHLPIATKWDASGAFQERVPFSDKLLSAGTGGSIDVRRLTGLFNLNRILRGDADLKVPQIGAYIGAILTLSGGKAVSRTPSAQQFTVLDTQDQPIAPPLDYDLEVEWTAPGGRDFELGGSEVPIKVGRGEEVILGHFDAAETDLPLRREIIPRPCADIGARQDVDFIWLYDLVVSNSTKRPLPTLSGISGEGPLTSTCFGGIWP